MEIEDFLDLLPSSCTEFDTLTLYDNDLGSLSLKEWSDFLDHLSFCQYLTTLDLGYNALSKLSAVQWTAFWLRLASCQYLIALDLRENYLGDCHDDQWTAFLAGLLSCTHLRALDLQRNHLYRLTPEKWTEFWAVISSSKNLKTLYFDDLYQFTPEMRTQFFAGASSCQHLTKLDLSIDGLFELTLTQWSEISFCSALTRLSLGFSSLGNVTSAQWTRFWEGVSFSSHLTRLDLYGSASNEFTPAQWTRFWEGISSCQHLTELGVIERSLYKLTPEQWTTFFAGISSCPNLTRLELSANKLGKLQLKQWVAFSAGISSCSNLTTLDLSCNEFGFIGTLMWFDLFKRGGLFSFQHLTSLSLAENNLARLFPSKSWCHFFLWLSSQPKLTKLDLRDNRLEQVSWAKVETLNPCVFIEHVFLSSEEVNMLSEPQLRLLGQAFPNASIMAQNYKDVLVRSDKIVFLQKQAGQFLLASVYALAQIEQKLVVEPTLQRGIKKSRTVCLPIELCIHIALYLPNSQGVIKGLLGLMNKEKFSCFMERRLANEPVFSYSFFKNRPLHYYDSLTLLHEALTLKERKGEDISMFCKEIRKSFFALERKRASEESKLLSFIEGFLSEQSDVPSLIASTRSSYSL